MNQQRNLFKRDAVLSTTSFLNALSYNQMKNRRKREVT